MEDIGSVESAKQFYDALTVEVVDNDGELEAGLHCELVRYYHALLENPERRPFYRYNWVRRIEPLARLLRRLPSREAPWRVLDAGCGMGTESIFCAALRDDVHVTGVDISSERLGVARARIPIYERCIGRPLRTHFVEQDVFSVLGLEQFDLIWSMEAISHIDPVEQFLVATHESLRQAGHLVISDSHALSPAMAWRVFVLRMRGVPQHSQKRTSGGQHISYAHERLLSVGRLARMLKVSGYASVRTQLSVYFPPALARFPRLFRTCVWGDHVLNRVPGVRWIGGTYTVVATK